MTNRAHIHEFYRKVKKRIFFLFLATFFKFGDLLEVYDMKVGNKCNVSALYLQNDDCQAKNTSLEHWGVNSLALQLIM